MMIECQRESKGMQRKVLFAGKERQNETKINTDLQRRVFSS